MRGKLEDKVTDDEWLAGLIDALLPGGEGFPAAHATGMLTSLASRLHQADANIMSQLATFLNERSMPPSDTRAWQEAARRLEALDPRLFGTVRKYAYLTYYEQPEVIDAIRALGLQYNHSPLPEGYPSERFVTERDAPRHTRGRWLSTEDVVPLDVASLGLEPLR